ncbi:hypothetical protein B0O80DRAFT_110582 [Mortierella sp. GBAus27b]|nr:hypothetical protein B0O80DRAFT_110449 [Mortierella sp. GBAus27b]KAI8351660.1 hypothetical protein B0O80DRAFT_110582 [Mortierella sp. GBAus27b]
MKVVGSCGDETYPSIGTSTVMGVAILIRQPYTYLLGSIVYLTVSAQLHPTPSPV